MKPCDQSPADGAQPAGSVLLVDDEPALLEIFAAVLDRHFNVERATHAREAEVLLKQKAFKVILADHRMPGETGLSFLARVKEAFPHTQRILVTGNMTLEMQRRAREGKLLFAFLIKPVSITELVDVVRAAAQLHDASRSDQT